MPSLQLVQVAALRRAQWALPTLCKKVVINCLHRENTEGSQGCTNTNASCAVSASYSIIFLFYEFVKFPVAWLGRIPPQTRALSSFLCRSCCTPRVFSLCEHTAEVVMGPSLWHLWWSVRIISLHTYTLWKSLNNDLSFWWSHPNTIFIVNGK